MSLFAAFAATLMTSLLVSIMLVVTQKLHGHLSFDSQFGVQKLHSAPTPRIGGIAVAMALGLGCVLLRGEAFDFGGCGPWRPCPPLPPGWPKI